LIGSSGSGRDTGDRTFVFAVASLAVAMLTAVCAFAELMPPGTASVADLVYRIATVAFAATTLYGVVRGDPFTHWSTSLDKGRP